MSVHTRNQQLAQKAYSCIENRISRRDFSEYETVARKFPALIHTCGLAQAVSFAQSKHDQNNPAGGAECEYLDDLAAVLCAGGHTELNSREALASHTRLESVSAYIRLSLDAINAAIWLKRYAEAISADARAKPEVKK